MKALSWQTMQLRSKNDRNHGSSADIPKITRFFPWQNHITLWLCQNSYGKSPFFMGKATINGHFQ
jgi:hypothetical protein